MKKFRITLRGTAPLLMHSARLADNLDPIVKEMQAISSKRTKTDDDRDELARLEFMGGMYFAPEVGPYIPGENIHATLIAGAKLSKKGAPLNRAMILTTDVNPLAYTGPRTVDAMWADPAFRSRKSVRVQSNRVTRTRPRFTEWACDAEGMLDLNVLDFGDLQRIADDAGLLIGLGDWRPRFGRFEATVEEL